MHFSSNNYFEIFSVPEAFQLDLSNLTDQYRRLQAQVHPDRFAGGTEQDKLRAIQATSLLNEAYETLKNPQKRAAYLLALQDIDLSSVDQADLSPQLLMEQIELREALEDLPRDESALDALEQLRQRIGDRQQQCQQRFESALAAGELVQAKRSYYEMQYFAKLAAEVAAIEEDLLGY